MRIGFDANALTGAKTAGAYYLSRLVRSLHQLNPRVEMVLFSADKICVDYEPDLHFPQVTRVALDLPRAARGEWPARYLPALLREYKVDVFHHPCIDGVPAFRPGRPTVVTLMGLGNWFLGGAFPSWPELMRYRFHHLCWSRIAARTLTLSETTRKDFIRFCRVSPDAAVVTSPGAGTDDLLFMPPDEADAIVGKYDLLGTDYIINPSGLSDRRHGLDFVLEGFASCLRRTDKDVRLLVTGSINYEGTYERALRRMDMLGIRGKVVLTGFVSDRVFAALLRGASAAVISSVYPGISFAMTEAFRAGVPVIASDHGCFPEIAGEAAIMVDPWDAEALALALQRLLDNDVERGLYVEKGVARANDFSWERMAQQTFNVYLALPGAGSGS